jgi:hypothetical protein
LPCGRLTNKEPVDGASQKAAPSTVEPNTHSQGGGPWGNQGFPRENGGPGRTAPRSCSTSAPGPASQTRRRRRPSPRTVERHPGPPRRRCRRRRREASPRRPGLAHSPPSRPSRAARQVRGHHGARFALPVGVAGAAAISTSVRAAAEATTSDLLIDFSSDGTNGEVIVPLCSEKDQGCDLAVRAGISAAATQEAFAILAALRQGPSVCPCAGLSSFGKLAGSARPRPPADFYRILKPFPREAS